MGGIQYIPVSRQFARGMVARVMEAKGSDMELHTVCEGIGIIRMPQ